MEISGYVGGLGGSWLPEEKKANMWHGRGKSGASWPRAFPGSFGMRKPVTLLCKLLSRVVITHAHPFGTAHSMTAVKKIIKLDLRVVYFKL